jgi:hypothetical protein
LEYTITILAARINYWVAGIDVERVRIVDRILSHYIL